MTVFELTCLSTVNACLCMGRLAAVAAAVAGAARTAVLHAYS